MLSSKASTMPHRLVAKGPVSKSSFSYRISSLNRHHLSPLSRSSKITSVSYRRTASLRVHAGLVEKITAEELEVAIQERDRPLIIDFYAVWCGPCVLLSAELEKVAEELGDKVRIVKIDTDENPELSSQLQIHGLPTMVFVGMNKSKPALRTEGLLPADVIKDIVERELK